jgi:hypothetical protein
VARPIVQPRASERPHWLDWAVGCAATEPTLGQRQPRLTVSDHGLTDADEGR